MSAPLAGKFQDHYKILGVEHKADSETIQRAYQALANRYHPKNKDTGDEEKYKAVTHAYEVLSDPISRKTFDDLRPSTEKETLPQFSGAAFFDAVGSEVSRRLCILCLLYDRRRAKPATGSLAIRQIDKIMEITPEQLQLSVWYLKQRNLVVADDKSALQITVEGMDYLEKNLPTADSILPLLRATLEAQPSAPAPQPSH